MARNYYTFTLLKKEKIMLLHGIYRKVQMQEKNCVTNETSGIYHTNKFYESFFLIPFTGNS